MGNPAFQPGTPQLNLMLHVVDDFLPTALLGPLQDLCLAHAALKQEHFGDALFSWRGNAGLSRSLHRARNQEVMERYLSDYLLPMTRPFAPEQGSVEWWCNTNNHLDWHIDKDEGEARTSGTYQLPLLSTVFYPHISCAGGELLVADNIPMVSGQCADLPGFNSVISIPPLRNRLVLFSAGVVHCINQFEGERYSVAANLWEMEPLDTPTSASLV